MNRVIPKVAGTNYLSFSPVTTSNFNTRSGQALSICLDTGATCSIVGRNALATHFPYVPIQQISSGVLILREVENGNIVSSSYVTLTLNLRSSSGRLVQVKGEFHVLPELASNLLVGADMLL